MNCLEHTFELPSNFWYAPKFNFSGTYETAARFGAALSAFTAVNEAIFLSTLPSSLPTTTMPPLPLPAMLLVLPPGVIADRPLVR